MPYLLRDMGAIINPSKQYNEINLQKVQDHFFDIYYHLGYCEACLQQQQQSAELVLLLFSHNYF